MSDLFWRRLGLQQHLHELIPDARVSQPGSGQCTRVPQLPHRGSGQALWIGEGVGARKRFAGLCRLVLLSHGRVSQTITIPRIKLLPHAPVEVQQPIPQHVHRLIRRPADKGLPEGLEGVVPHDVVLCDAVVVARGCGDSSAEERQCSRGLHVGRPFLDLFVRPFLRVHRVGLLA